MYAQRLPTLLPKSFTSDQIEHLLTVLGEKLDEVYVYLDETIERMLSQSALSEAVKVRWNKGYLQELGFKVVETYRYSPESGFILSTSEATFVDGVTCSPLIVEIWADEQQAKKVALIKPFVPAGFKAIVGLKVSDRVEAKPIRTRATNGYLPGVILTDYRDATLSGKSKTQPLKISLEMMEHVDADLIEASTCESVHLEMEARSIEAVSQGILAACIGGAATAPIGEITGQTSVTTEATLKMIRSGWSPAVDFLRDDITFLDTDLLAQSASIKLEV